MYLNIKLENNHELCKRVMYALQHESNFYLNSSDEIFLKIYSDIINQGIYNPDFNSVEFDGFIKQAGLHTFSLSVKNWCEKTNAIGMYSKRGKYGGTYAHKDIAF